MNYIEMLYEMRIRDFNKTNHRLPRKSELKSIGVNYTYIKRKYQNIYNYYRSLGYQTISYDDRVIIVVDKFTDKYLRTTYRSELTYPFRINDLSPNEQKYLYFTQPVYEVFKRCESRKEFKDVMWFKYGKNLYFHARTKRKHANRKRRLQHMKDTIPLEELIDVKKFEDIEYI